MTNHKSDNTALNYLADCVQGAEGTRVIRVSTSVVVTQNLYLEGATLTLNTTPKDGSINLAKGTTGQIMKKVRISVPGNTDVLSVIFYDNTPTTTPITGTLYLDGQPSDGFDLTGLALTSGTIGYRIIGCTTPTDIAYITVSYTY